MSDQERASAAWLTGDQVAELEAELAGLITRHDAICGRMTEIRDTLVASGESKVRAMRDAAEWAGSDHDPR